MQTNNILDFSRLGKYMALHLSVSMRTYVLGILAMFGGMSIFSVITIYSNHTVYSQSDIIPFYYIGMYFIGLLFTSMSFSDFSSKEKSVSFFMLPASSFEKFITAFLFTSVGFLAVYHLCAYTSFHIIDWGMMHRYDKHIVRDWDFFNADKGHIYLYYVYIFLHAIFLLGAISFNKASFIKTLLTACLVPVALGVINVLFLYLLFGNNWIQKPAHLPFVLVAVEKGGNGGVYMISQGMIDTYIFIAKYLLTPIFWTIAYFRLKDKEI
ncbi:hypothetical protein [Chitinophaga solisilvae]|uniref:Uncharacterized protein n=1 Tax=Chitinophaga solisilvae TaxID=1233460 RepID=A0A433WIZ3_9BACT|nr:hypothetical protein [Chitinophaga solisilvae]NSL88847.1 hypothetical protein [Chitinophaga solisilvae]